MVSNSNWDICFAGAFAGISVNLLIFPLDTLKTRIQAPSYNQLYKTQTAIANRTLFHGLYQGISTVTFVAVPSCVVFFTTYEGLKHALGSTWIPQPAVHLVSSSIAQLLNCAVVTPAEVLKQNAQMIQREDRGRGRASPTAMVARSVMKDPRGLLRGYTALVARDLPYTALQFPVFEYLKRTLMTRRERYNSGKPAIGVFESGSVAAVSAATAGSAAAWVTTPFDVIKTRMMLNVGAEHRDQHLRTGGGATHRGPLQICKSVMREEGFKGFFRGGLIRALFTMAGNGLFMGFYEGAKIYLGK